MSLSEYKKKRSFSKTPEPSGATAPKAGAKLGFVIQKHDASHLHYDLRLEMNGAMKSWAVPKGPSLNPKDKRLAMLVEDHPMEYNKFEGVIPPGNYGAGTVIIWDRGTYEPYEDPKLKSSRPLTTKKGKLTRKDYEKIFAKGFYSGSLKFKLHGKKLKGEFALVKIEGRGENAWLLIKHRDDYASEEDITLQDRSVVSGKNLEEMASEKKPKEWISNRSSSGKLKKPEKVKQPARSDAVEMDYDEIISSVLSSFKKKKKSPMPSDLKPMLATLVDKPFDNPSWIFEIKWDGYRALAYINNGKAELRSRNNNPFNEKFYPIHDALKQWPIKAVVDGEIVVVNEKGLSSFSPLQNWRSEADGELLFYVFDILWLEGYDCMQLPLVQRREILRQIVPSSGLIRFSQNFDATGTDFFVAAQSLGLEGIIAKLSNSEYIPDTRTRSWLKIKTEQRHEAVIAGYTRNEGSNKTFSALILGVYQDNELQFIGQAGTGFTDKLQSEILKKLKSLETNKCPFRVEPVINKPTRFRPKPPKAAVTWVKPVLVCEVKYQELTSDGIMRHPSFQGLREDKNAKDVKLDVAFDVSKREGETKVQTHKKLEKAKVIRASSGKDRHTFLNPKDETQTKVINGRELQFTNLSKLYWPKERITKRDMLNYYYSMVPYMLPYMKDRPQSLNRHPNGINGSSFYQKNVAGKVDKWITTHHYLNTTHPGEKTFFVCTDEASLLYIAKLGCIEMNPWHSRTKSPDNPDWCVIDLDPDTNSFEEVIEAANVVKKILDAAGIPSFPKTSGSTGIHIYVPLGAKYDYDQSRQLAELIVTFAHEELPGFTSIVRNPLKRKGKIYLDFLQNRAIQTIAAPYSLRPKPGATVSAPLHWDEVKKGLKISDFNFFNMQGRVKDVGDIFGGVLGKGIDLEKVLKKIASDFK